MAGDAAALARGQVLEAGIAPERGRAGRSAIARGSARPLPGLPSPRIVFAGRLHPEKGPDVLLDAAARMRYLTPLYLLGAGRMEAELRRRAEQLRIADRVRFEGWRD